jgi:hypothetical protein
MVKPQVRMLASIISHMPLHAVWRDSGVTQKHGFELIVDVANVPLADGSVITMKQRAPLLLDGTYDFLSGLHHETYVYRARGDKRLVYIAQAQNDWDDRVVAREGIRSAKDLEGQKVVVADRAPCVFGNLKHSIQVGGANLDAIEFVSLDSHALDVNRQAVERVARGEAAAAQVDMPFDLQGEKLGLHGLDIPSVPVIHNATMCANRDFIIRDPETTIAFLKSMIDAIHYFKKQKSRVCEILERSLAPVIGIQGADEIEHLHAGWAKLLSPKPYPHPLAVWNVYNLDVAHDPNVNFIGPFETWDTSYLRTIDDGGYIDELYDGAHMARNPEVNPVI